MLVGIPCHKQQLASRVRVQGLGFRVYGVIHDSAGVICYLLHGVSGSEL